MRVSTACIIVSTAATARAFAPISTNVNVRTMNAFSPLSMSMEEEKSVASFDPLNLSSSSEPASSSESDLDLNLNNVNPAMASLLAVTTIALSPTAAHAAGPDWGIFEGRTGSLLHPITMGGAFLFSLSTGYLGFQYRRQRTLGGEISALKKTLPSLNGEKSLSAAISAAQGAEVVDSALVMKLKSAMPVQQQIDELTAERKDLSKKNLRDNHFSQGSLLAFIGTAFAIEGPLNTYARAGKLFPGPHLYAGAGLVVLWAAAAACVPAMQKGNDTARSIHIGANVAGTGLFAWQILTGWPILQKVVQLTHWP